MQQGRTMRFFAPIFFGVIAVHERPAKPDTSDARSHE